MTSFSASSGTDTLDGGVGTDTFNATGASSLVGETISVMVDNNGDGTVSKTNDGTIDTFTSIERFVAGEVDGQNDVLTITGAVDPNNISGISDSATGIFTSSQLGIPIPFGGVGQPTINELLSGSYDPGTGPISPNGSYAILEWRGRWRATWQYSGAELRGDKLRCRLFCPGHKD